MLGFEAKEVNGDVMCHTSLKKLDFTMNILCNFSLDGFLPACAFLCLLITSKQRMQLTVEKVMEYNWKTANFDGGVVQKLQRLFILLN